jgi:heavy metal translocating P-type ATPase
MVWTGVRGRAAGILCERGAAVSLTLRRTMWHRFRLTLELRTSAATRATVIAAAALVGILVHVILRFGTRVDPALVNLPLYAVLAVGGVPLVVELAVGVARGRFGSDILAGISIVTALLLGEYLAGSIVVLMLAGGQALESFAVGRASTVLQALARRMPSVAHRRTDGIVKDISLDEVAIGDRLTIFPHEICPVDGEVVEGHGVMDESYLTGEPFMMSKAPGSEVYSGAINGEAALTVKAVRRAVDSRYARIMEMMRESQQRRPRLRRLGDQLGAVYTPVAVAIATAAWAWSGDPVRFLAVLVVATPCPLLIGIPVAIIGTISLAAKRGVIVRDPAALEQIDRCRTILLDKTGTLTSGQPVLADQHVASDADEVRVIQLAASVERYSRHPLASAILAAAAERAIPLLQGEAISERPGEGLEGMVEGRRVQIVGRRHVARLGLALPGIAAGLECVVLVDGRYAATFRFRDTARPDSHSFIRHLRPRHSYTRIVLVSGDRDEEVRYLAERVGITEVHAGQSPEDKVALTRAETARAPTLFLGDGINDAPALAAATVGVAFGHQNPIAAEAADAVIMDTSLERVDELFHMARRMRRVALQSAVGGMALSVVGMLVAFAGYLPPVGGAVFQEAIDLAAVFNALRAASPGGALSDY